MRIAIFCLATVAVASACASTATTADPSAPHTQRVSIDGMAGSLRISAVTDASSLVLNASADNAYRVLPLVYDSLSIPKTWLDPKTFLISSQGFKIRTRLGKTSLSRFIDCGSTQIGANADSYDVYMTVTSKLAGSGETSTLSTTVEAAARPLSFNQDYTRCSSRGELERRIGALAKAFLTQ
jgi:hypothetical protein